MYDAPSGLIIQSKVRQRTRRIPQNYPVPLHLHSAGATSTTNTTTVTTTAPATATATATATASSGGAGGADGSQCEHGAVLHHGCAHPLGRRQVEKRGDRVDDDCLLHARRNAQPAERVDCVVLHYGRDRVLVVSEVCVVVVVVDVVMVMMV